jgi:hypothetical protein
MNTKMTLSSLYSFPGFRAIARLKEVPGDLGARLVTLRRRSKKHLAPVVTHSAVFMITSFTKSGTWTREGCGFTCPSSTVASIARSAKQ